MPQTIDEAAFVKSIELKVWNKVAKIRLRPFEEARAFTHTLKLQSYKEWQLFSKTTELPSDILAYPDQAYQNKGWISWGTGWGQRLLRRD